MSWWDDLWDSITSSADTPESAAAAQSAAGALSGVDVADALQGDSGLDFSGVDWGTLGGLAGGSSGSADYSTVGGVGPDSAAYAQRQGVGGLATDGVAEPPGALTRIMQGLGIAGKDGSVDYSDPKVMDRILKSVMTGGNVLYALTGGNKPRGYKSPAQLRAELAGPFNNWTPQQSATVQGYFDRPITGPRPLAARPTTPQSIVGTPRYAEGGEVDDSSPSYHSSGALNALVQGPGGGQDDLVPARLGRGEYVFDADVVAALGDGSNERGAELLDKWRAELRAHKRAAPAHKIPPKAKAPESYLRKVKKAS